MLFCPNGQKQFKPVQQIKCQELTVIIYRLWVELINIDLRIWFKIYTRSNIKSTITQWFHAMKESRTKSWKSRGGMAFQCRCVILYTYCAMRWCNFFVSIFFVNAQKAEKKKEIKNAGTRTTVKKWCQNLSRDNKPQKSFKMQHSTHQHFDQDFFFHILYLLLAGLTSTGTEKLFSSSKTI